MKIKAIIVDDEENSRITMHNMLTNFCKGVDVIGQASSVEEASKLIRSNKPDVVFLDIEMPEQNGFKLLEHFENPTFDIIFTTAYNQYAAKAFRLAAIDYLLKPIDLEELRESLQRVKNKSASEQKTQRIIALRDNINHKLSKLALPTNDGYIFLELDDIIRCEAQGNYTIFYTKREEKIVVSKTLKIFDEMLRNLNFFRINRSHLINLKYIKKYGRQKNPTITMIDGSILSLTEGRKHDFFDKFDTL